MDIRYVDVHRVAAYLTKYLTGAKIEHTLSLLPVRARIFSTSRGLSLSEKREKSGWWLNRVSIETASASARTRPRNDSRTIGVVKSASFTLKGSYSCFHRRSRRDSDVEAIGSSVGKTHCIVNLQ